MVRHVEVGETVYAKWPGSTKFYEAVVKSVDKAKCEVEFKGEEYETLVPFSDVYHISYFQQRSKSSSPSRRARSRSPGRRRSRSRSPARRRTAARSSPSPPKRQGRSPGRPSNVTAEKNEPETPKRSPVRSRKAKGEKVSEEKTPSPKKPSPKPERRGRTPKKVAPQPETPTRITRSLTKSLVKEEKEALLGSMYDEEKEKDRKRGRREYEFGGPFGAFVFIFGLPVCVFAFYFFCVGKDGKCSFRQQSVSLPQWKEFFNPQAHLVYAAWMLYQVLLYMLPFGNVIKGPQLADGSQLDYRINGLFALLGTIALFFALMANKIPVTFVYDNFLSLITATILWSVVISVFLFVKAKRQGSGLSPGGNTGNAIYDFFMGHQLNPRIGNFDFKFFCEMRPGLLGWMMINFCLAVKESNDYGSLSPAMLLVCAFQFIYVADCLLFEASILSTIDMVHEGFGYMLAFGDLAFVPFMYSLQARFLVDHRTHLHWAAIVSIVALKVVGYVIFRGSNLQKDYFRQHPEDPEFKDRETILTPSLLLFHFFR
ncbi:delta(14)-sterol reductase TM7SF2 isoform X2 [Nematostella vectensis]|uniref:delta(14)-sterol reductase TM7SF2 isoform X2 n=1 Tax=Nematostella vectensis TaxID=45351 RepID=UPI00207780A8|nr:delta(14)-sterol reductase TM7SF2 isoform X2 [Nematostella vectensis]